MKSKKVLFIIIPICAALIAAIVLLVLFLTGAFLSPKARVMLALSRTFGSGSIISEYSGNTNISKYGYAPEYLAELLSISDTFTSMKERGYSFDTSYSLTDLDTGDDYGINTLSGAGIKLAGDVDTVNRIAYYDLTMKNNFLRVSLGEYYINDSSISFAMPSYFDGYLTLPTETFGTSYNASVFPSLFAPIPQELESSISFSAFDLLCPTSGEDTFIDSSDGIEVLKEFYDAIEVDKTGETRPIVIGTKQQDCSEYKITIDEDAVLALIEAYEDWYFSSNRETIEKYEVFYAYLASLDSSDIDPSVTLSDKIESVFDAYKDLLAVDHEIYVYLDHKNRLAAASYENELDTRSICHLFDEEADTLMDEFEENLSFDDFISYYVNGTISNFDILDDSFTDTDVSDAPDMPETCTISAEIIFHGRDYLPERYEGSFLFALDNGYSCEIDYTGENKSDTDDIYHSVLHTTLGLTDTDATTTYDVVYNASYQTQDKNLTAEVTVTDENNRDVLNINLDGTAILENDTIELNMEELTITAGSGSDKYSISMAAETSISPLSDRVPLPEGRERNLFTMSEGDYEKLGNEIIDNLW